MAATFINISKHPLKDKPHVVDSPYKLAVRHYNILCRRMIQVSTGQSLVLMMGMYLCMCTKLLRLKECDK